MSENNNLTTTAKLGVKKVGLQGIRAQAREALRDIKPEECQHRLAIGFDDSGSMDGQSIADAKKAVAGFLASCNPKDTSVAIVPFSYICDPEGHLKAQPLTIQYDLINLYLASVQATSSTPLYGTMTKMMQDFPITRGILFSDGGSTDKENLAEEEEEEPNKLEQKAVLLAIERKIPFDTVSIGAESEELKHIAEVTGGVYIFFTDTSVFAKSMKYLAPKYVALLANAELKEKIQRGETI
jgi:Mg-chelatase subunit ChlD